MCQIWHSWILPGKSKYLLLFEILPLIYLTQSQLALLLIQDNPLLVLKWVFCLLDLPLYIIPGLQMVARGHQVMYHQKSITLWISGKVHSMKPGSEMHNTMVSALAVHTDHHNSCGNTKLTLHMPGAAMWSHYIEAFKTNHTHFQWYQCLILYFTSNSDVHTPHGINIPCLWSSVWSGLLGFLLFPQWWLGLQMVQNIPDKEGVLLLGSIVTPQHENSCHVHFSDV